MKAILAVVGIIILLSLLSKSCEESNSSRNSTEAESEFVSESEENITSRARYEDIPEMSPQEFYDLCEEKGLGKSVNVDANGNIIVVNEPAKYKFTAPCNITMSEAGASFYSDVGVMTKERNFGGVKLLTDLSAQASGIYNVNDLKAGQVIYFYTPSSWGFEIPERNSSRLFSAMCNKEVNFISGKVLEMKEGL